MNQLLVSGRVYMTPELKRKRLIYKGYVLISVFLVCLLMSYHIYGEYKGVQDEAIAKDMLSNIIAGSKEDTTMAPIVDDAVVVFLDNQEEMYGEGIEPIETFEPTGEDIIFGESVEINTPLSGQYTDSKGKVYGIVGIIKIDKIDLEYPILDETTNDLLNVSVCKFWGPNPNEVGNLVIAGHNFTNTRAFSKVSKLDKGDIIEITDLTGKTIKYEIYTHYIVKSNDTTPTSQITHGCKEVTLITCTNGLKERRIVKAIEINE